MKRNKLYSCRLCGTSPDQISHHLAHLKSQKHKDKYSLFSLFLSNFPSQQLFHLFKTSDTKTILSEFETSLYSSSPDQKLNFDSFCPSLKSTMQQYHTSISNKEALKDKIHEIHNYMRNHGIGYGMNALKTFNVLYGLKKIEDSGLIDVCHLQRPYCEFSYMVKLARDGKHDELTECILRHALDSLAKSPLRHLLFYEIEGNVRASVFSWLVKEIDQVGLIEKTCNVLLSGKIYEYFIGRDETAISELGAYFTDRHIVDFIVDRIQPTLREDGTVYPMIDMFGGSGGFTTGYVQHLQQKYPDRIDWKTEIKNVYHYDMNDDVVKSARLELFCLTGAIPDEFRLGTRSSFADEFGDRKFHYILTNPPYGGDKQDTTEAMVKQQKIMDYIKKELTTLQDDTVRVRRQRQLKALEDQEKQYKQQQDKLKVSRRTCSARINRFIVKNKISKANDKESCSLILMMDLLDVGGTAVGVLKEGVFFNKTYKDIRRVLVEEFNVREIISVPSDQFENTSTKTSIVIFDNTEEKTSTIKFSDLVVERYMDDRFEEIGGDVYLVDNKGDIKGVSAGLICEATREEILAHEMCSLNPKEYLKREIRVGEGYELKRLGDICDIRLGTRITKKGCEKGNTPVYGGGDITFYTEKPNREKGTLIVSRYAMSKECVRLIQNDFYLNDSGLSLHSMNPYLQKYMNFFLLSDRFQNYIYRNCTAGSIQRNIVMNLFKEAPVIFPQSPEKLKEWTDKISEPYNEVQTKREKLKELEKQVQDRIREITENEECQKIKLGDITDINMGATPDTKQSKYWENGDIPWVAVSDLHNNIVYETNKYLTEEGAKKMAKRKIPKKSILLSFKLSIGKLGITGREMYCNEAIVYLNSKIQSIPQMFLYYILRTLDLQQYGRGTIGKHGNLNKEILQNIFIAIPKNKQLIKDLEPTFQEIENLQHDIQVAEKRYKQYIQELSEEAMPSSS